MSVNLLTYFTERFPDSVELIEIHLSCRLTSKTIVSFDSPGRENMLDGPPPQYVKEIFRIPGVKEVDLYPFSIAIHRGKQFSWDKMLPKILQAIKSHFSPKQPMREEAPNKPFVNAAQFRCAEMHKGELERALKEGWELIVPPIRAFADMDPGRLAPTEHYYLVVLKK